MNTRRFALALAVLALAVPATAVAKDGTEILAKESSAPTVAMRVNIVLRTNEPNQFAETVGYELTGLFAVTSLGDVSADLPDTHSRFSDLGPSAVSADELASLLVGLRDRSSDPALAEAVNSLGGVLTKGHVGVEATLGEQLDGIVEMLGLSPATAVPGQKAGADSNAFMIPGWQLYADGEQPADDTDLTPPPLVSINEDGSETVFNGDGSRTNSEPGNPAEWSDPSKPEAQRAPDPEQIRDAIVDAVKSVKSVVTSVAETYTSMPVYIGVTIKGGTSEGLPTMGGMTINFNLPPYKKYVDPDATDGTSGIALSPDEVGARLTNELKDPVRPDDVQEAPPAAEHPKGADPTLELYDPDAIAGTLAAGTDPQQVHPTAPIDFHPDTQPLTPETNPAPTGDEPPDG